MRRFLTAAALLMTSLAAPPALADLGPPPGSNQGYTVESGRLVLPDGMSVQFQPGTATMTPASRRAVMRIAKFMGDKSAFSLVRIEGHVAPDADASPAVIQKLSEERALAVARAIIAEGVDCKRLLAVGFGSTKPVTDNRTLVGRATNTRIVVQGAALRGHAIGGMPVDGGGVVAGDVCK
jgi:OmpA-OmpF porin, OOP family